MRFDFGAGRWEITGPDRLDEPVSAFGLTHKTLALGAMAAPFGKRDVFVWLDHFYVVNLTEALGYRQPAYCGSVLASQRVRGSAAFTRHFHLVQSLSSMVSMTRE
jgi:hypothetical protein